MQDYTFIPSVGMEPHEFWAHTTEVAAEEVMDSILAYMYCMVETALQSNNPLTRDMLLACGKHIEYHPGVEGWFERINRYAEKFGIEVEHYVLSSGLKEIIEGTSIAKYFKRIYACEFLYKDGHAYWPKMAVNYTNKTQFVYRINKGVLDINNNTDLNNSRPDSEKRVFFRNMIYIGDGLTDVPSMKMVRMKGGCSIAVHAEGDTKTVDDMLLQDRADFAIEADYRAGSEMEQTVHALLRQIRSVDECAALHSLHLDRARERAARRNDMPAPTEEKWHSGRE
jgi:2-hydroxy-3-keto-5-methylthiopentenyl-1-phosphate phosphatase